MATDVITIENVGKNLEVGCVPCGSSNDPFLEIA